MRFFNIDSKFFRFMTRVGDLILLSLLWLLFSLPVITCGAATTALYHTVHKLLRDQGNGTVREFWKGFRSNFPQATVIWLIVLVLASLLGGNLLLAYKSEGGTSGTLFRAFAVFDVIAVAWTLYFFPYAARFEAKTGRILKNSFILLTMNIGSSLLLLADFAAAVVLTAVFYTMPLVPMFVPALYTVCADHIIEKVFTKYLPSDDGKET